MNTWTDTEKAIELLRMSSVKYDMWTILNHAGQRREERDWSLHIENVLEGAWAMTHLMQMAPRIPTIVPTFHLWGIIRWSWGLMGISLILWNVECLRMMLLISTKPHAKIKLKKNNNNNFLFSNLLFQKFSVFGLRRCGPSQMRDILDTCFGYFLIIPKEGFICLDLTRKSDRGFFGLFSVTYSRGWGGFTLTLLLRHSLFKSWMEAFTWFTRLLLNYFLVKSPAPAVNRVWNYISRSSQCHQIIIWFEVHCLTLKIRFFKILLIRTVELVLYLYILNDLLES